MNEETSVIVADFKRKNPKCISIVFKHKKLPEQKKEKFWGETKLQGSVHWEKHTHKRLKEKSKNRIGNVWHANSACEKTFIESTVRCD